MVVNAVPEGEAEESTEEEAAQNKEELLELERMEREMKAAEQEMEMKNIKVVVDKKGRLMQKKASAVGRRRKHPKGRMVKGGSKATRAGITLKAAPEGSAHFGNGYVLKCGESIHPFVRPGLQLRQPDGPGPAG